MLVRILGRPQVDGREGPQDLRGTTQIRLLALLAAHRGRALRREVIHDELWGEAEVSASAVRITMLRLRRVFEGAAGVDPIATSPAGYALAVGDDDIDAGRFRTALDASRRAWTRGDAAAAARHAADGEALWRGPAYEDVSGVPSIVPEQNRLDDERRDLRDLAVACHVVEGRISDALELVGRAVADDPYRESTRALHLAALAIGGRSGDAVRAYEEQVVLFRTDLGIGPSPALVTLREAIGRGAGRDEVLALAAPDAPSRADLRAAAVADGATPARPRLVGRRAELAALAALVAGSGPTTWIVEGPAGVGKTRLGEEVRDRAAAEGLAVASGTCPRDVGAGPVLLREVLADLLAAIDPILLADPSVGGVVAAAFPELASGISGVSAAREVLTGELAETRLYAALDRVFASLPPTVIVLDDVHRIDGSIGSLLAHLVPRSEQVRWVLLARTGDRRPRAIELLADLARHGATLRALAPLDVDDATRLVKAVAPDLGDDVVAAAVARGGGNPFALSELARHAGAGGDVDAVPGTVAAVVSAEVARLGDDSADLARTIAVAGRRHPVGAVTAAAGLQGRRASAALGALIANGFAATDVHRRQVWPGHDLVRDALVDDMLEPEVMAVHRRLAEALDTTPVDDPALRLGHLLADALSADDDLEHEAAIAFDAPALMASPYELSRLGEQVLARTGLVGSTHHGLAWRLRVAMARFAAGDASGGTRLLVVQQPGLDDLDDPELHARALVTQIPITLSPDRLAEAERRAVAIVDRLPASARALRVGLTCWIGMARLLDEDIAGARRWADLAEAAIDGTDSPIAEAEILAFRIATSLTFDAPPGETDRILAEVEELAARTTDVVVATDLVLARFEQASRRGTIDDLAVRLAEAERYDSPLSRVESRWWVAAGRAGLAFARGDLDAGRRAYLDAMDLGARHQIDIAMRVALLHRFVLDDACGDLHLFHPLMPPPTAEVAPAMLASSALVCLAAGDDVGATAAADLLVRPGLLAGLNPGTWPTVAALGAQAAWQLGHAALGRELGEALASRGEEGLTATGFCYLGSTTLARGLASAAADDVDGAIDLLHAAVDREAWFGSVLHVAQAAAAGAVLHERRGRSGDAADAARLRDRAAEARAAIVWPEATEG